MFTTCFHGPGTDNLTGMKLQFLEFITPMFRILVNINGWVITCLLGNNPCVFKETGRTSGSALENPVMEFDMLVIVFWFLFRVLTDDGDL
ncbi:hypothetical protein HanPSC8_Chr17g0775251 [Helianthus annuus]|nr:hypothetical protein HanPSC8_Chr17g0775251 [Helianthus annuus]